MHDPDSSSSRKDGASRRSLRRARAEPREVIRKAQQGEPQVVAVPLTGPEPAQDQVAQRWADLPVLTLKPRLLERNLVITAGRAHPAHGAFDVLRTKLVQALAERKWRRVGVTSPTKGCGKSFTAVNLAITLSRYDECRTVLMDMDMRRPAIAHTLGVQARGAMGDFLRGRVPPEEFLQRVGPNELRIGPSLAIGLNGREEPFAAEMLFEPATRAALANLEAALAPRVVLFDLPPALAQDDVIALKPHLDCVLMVAGGGKTTPRELQETTRRLGEDLPVLGIVLNQAEDRDAPGYAY